MKAIYNIEVKKYNKIEAMIRTHCLSVKQIIYSDIEDNKNLNGFVYIYKFHLIKEVRFSQN